MSLEDGIRGDGTEHAFWKIRELVEKLLPYLGLESIKHLAEVHKLTRHILGKAFVWKRLIKRTFPEDVKIRLDLEWSPMLLEDDAHLANDLPRARLLAHILGLIKSSKGSQPEVDLLHAVCERYPVLDGSLDARRWFHFVDVRCAACLKSHQVSPWGFVLLEEIQATLGEKSTLMLDVDLVHSSLSGPFLMALNSMATRQQGMEMRILPYVMVCNSKESAEAIENLAKAIQATGSYSIDVDGEIEIKGWAAIRKVVEHLTDGIAPVPEIWMDRIDRKTMASGAKEDLKAIWGRVSFWNVISSGWNILFVKEADGERAGWEGVEGEWKGLEDVISMTEEEWIEEAEKRGYHHTDEESESQEFENEESESEESESEESEA